MTSRLAAVWLQIELRRRWRALILLTLLIALCAGALLATVAGARRGASAADRLLAQTLPATAIVHTNQEQIDYWPQVRDLPGVAAVSTFPAYSGFGVDEAPADTVSVYLPLDADAMRTIERPVLLAGRLADPSRADEAVVTQRFTDVTGYGVGDRVTIRLFTPEQINDGTSAVPTTQIPRPAGPAVPARIVGIVRSPWFSDSVGDRGRLIPSPGLAAAYPRNILGAALDSEQWALVRLTDGDAGLPRLRQQLSTLVPTTPGPDILPRSDTIEHLHRVTRFEAACLWGLAGAVLLASSFVVATSITRQVTATRADLEVAAALGATRMQTATLSAAGPATAGVAGALLGAALAIAGSGWFPFGVAATLEPAPGLRADGLVIGAGVPLVAVAVAGWAVLASAVQHRRPMPRESRLARRATAAGLPVPVFVGLRHALEPGTGRRAIPVRSAVTGAVAGVLGVTAALTFAAAAADAADSPQRFGQTHQLVIAFGYSGTDLSCAPAAMRITARDRSVTSITDLRFQTAQLTAASTGTGRTITVFTATDRSGAPSSPVLVDGRAATGPDDIVLAPTTARRLGAVLGSAVPLAGQLPGGGYGATGADVPVNDPCTASARPSFGAEPGPAVPGDKTAATLTVTGIGFVPQTQYNEYDSGAWVSPETYQRLFGTGFVNHEALVGVTPGADPGTVAGRLRPAFAALPGGSALFTSYPQAIQRAAEISDLRSLPLVLSVFLAVLGLAATAHVLLVSSRRHRAELGVLRAVGMTRPQARWVSAIQAAVYAVIGLVLGVPLGIALGGTLWKAVARSTPLAYARPLPWVALVLITTVTLIAVQILAIPTAQRSVRLKVAEVLRAE